MKTFIPNQICKFKKGKGLESYHTFQRFDKAYCYLMAAEYNNCPIGDCWVINRHGELHPGYSISPIPVNVNDVVAVECMEGIYCEN